jgi:hypothetical protein
MYFHDILYLAATNSAEAVTRLPRDQSAGLAAPL